MAFLSGDAVGGTVGYRTNPILKLNSFTHALLRSYARALLCLPASLSACLSICAPVAPNCLTIWHFNGYHLRKIAQVTYWQKPMAQRFK